MKWKWKWFLKLNRALIKSHGMIPFVAKPLRGKTVIKNGLKFED